MTRFPARADVACIIGGGLILAFGLAVMVFGPQHQMPVHYGPGGAVDRLGGRGEVGGLIAGLGLMAVVLCGLFGWAIARTADEARARGLRLGQTLVVAILSVVACFIGGLSLGGVTSISGVLPMMALSLMFVVIGAFLGRVPPNPVMGVRTPWAYKSRLAWDRSNRLAGRLFFLIGLAGMVFAGVAPRPYGLIGLIGAVLIAAVWSAYESWRVWRDDPERQPF